MTSRLPYVKKTVPGCRAGRACAPIHARSSETQTEKSHLWCMYCTRSANALARGGGVVSPWRQKAKVCVATPAHVSLRQAAGGAAGFEPEKENIYLEAGRAFQNGQELNAIHQLHTDVCTHTLMHTHTHRHNQGSGHMHKAFCHLDLFE